MKKIGDKKLRSDHKLMLGVKQIRELRDELIELAYEEFGFWLDWDDINRLFVGISPKELLLSKGYKRGRDVIREAIVNALSQVFEDGRVTTSDGYKDNIHVRVVSEQFVGVSDHVRLGMVFDVLDDPSTGISKAERTLISLILPFSPDEIEEERNDR